MRLPIYQVDAFASRVFAGNPAAVVPLAAWLPDATLQAIAAENNLSETAFLVPEGGEWAIRWMTPEVEVDLCGHATLASAHVVFERLDAGRRRVVFRSASGEPAVRRDGDRLAMTFPRRPAETCPAPPALARALGRAPLAVLRSRDYLAVLPGEEEVRGLAPDLAAVRELEAQGLIVTAPGRSADFVSRYFAPQAGIPEDPVTGSAHSTLVPYWSARLGKGDLHGLQVSRRGGDLFCRDLGHAVEIAGRAAMYLEGTIEVPDLRP